MKKILSPLLLLSLMVFQNCSTDEDPSSGIANFIIKDASGTTLNNVKVSIYANEADAVKESNATASATTGNDGNVTFNLTKGGYAFRAVSPDVNLYDSYGAFTISNGKTDNYTVTLEPSTGIINVLVKDINDNLLPSVVLTIYANETDAENESNPITSQTTDSNGEASFTLNEGSYAMRAVSPDPDLEDFVGSFTVAAGSNESDVIVLQ